MVHCWEEYMWKVHKAVPMDPWADNLQLLDVLIQDQSPSSWLPSWLRRRDQPRMTRVGSIFLLGAKDSLVDTTAWKAQELVDEGHEIRKNETTTGSLQASDMKSNGSAVAINLQPPSAHAPTGNTHASNGADAASAAAPLPVSNIDTDVNALLNSFVIISSGMPDIQTSIKTSTSLLASLTGGSSSASAQFDVKGSKSINCNVNGVKSRRIDVDALLGIVTPRTVSGMRALWRPDIHLPQLCWSPKRGQTLWVVVEIMYANKIKIEADNQNQANANGQLKAANAEEVNLSTQVGIQKDGLWMVMASTDNPVFPLAFRLQRLDYDASGNLISKHKKHLQRNSSLNIKSTKTLSSKQVSHPLSRSLSVAPMLS